MYSSKLTLMIIVCSLYATNQIGMAIHYEISVIEFIILNLTDIYYVIYGMLLFYLVFVLRLMNKENLLILTRNRSISVYLKRKIISLSLFTIFFVVIHVLISGIIGILNLPSVSGFTETPLSNAFVLVPLDSFREIFSCSFTGLFIISCYMIFGLVFFTVCNQVLRLYFNKRVVVILVALIYFSNLIPLHFEWTFEIPIIFMNYYIMFSPVNTRNILMIVFSFSVTFCLLFLVKRRWRLKLYEM